MPQVQQQSPDGVIDLCSPLVGRDSELALLNRRIDALYGGKGGIITVLGEAGLGKTRLVAEARAAPRAGLRWAEGHALPSSREMSYWMVRGVALDLLGIGPHGPPEDAAAATRSGIDRVLPGEAEDVAPFVLHLLGLPVGDESASRIRLLPPESLRGLMEYAFMRYVRALAAETPTVLVWEDLHWADSASLHLLETLLPLCLEVPLLFLLVFRPVDEGDARDVCRRVLAGSVADVSRIDLVPLSQEESAVLMGRLLMVDRLPQDMRRLIFRTSEGNPLFLEELVSVLVEAGTLLLRGGRLLVTRPMADVALPETLEDAIATRLERLPTTDKEALQMASVLGWAFQEPLLAAMRASEGSTASAHAAGTLSSPLRQLQRRGLVRGTERDGTGAEVGYAFKHSVTHEVAYGSLLPVQRKALHRVAGRALEGFFAERLEELSPVLADHFARGGEPERALQYYEKAGHAAMALYSNASAASFYASALEQIRALAPPEGSVGDSKREASLSESLGNCLSITGKCEEARAAFGRALSLPAVGADSLWRARLHLKIARTWSLQHRPEQAFQEDANAIEILGSPPPEGNAAWWQSWLDIQLDRQWALYTIAKVAEMTELSTRMRPIVERLGTALQRYLFHKAILMTRYRSERYAVSDETIAVARAARGECEKVGDPVALSNATFGLGFGRLWRDELSEAESLISESLGLAQRTNHLEWQVLAHIYLAVLHRKRGEAEQVRDHTQRGSALAGIIGQRMYVATSLANEAWLAEQEGRPDEVVERGHAALDIWKALPVSYPFQWLALWPLIGVALAEGRTREAVEHAQALLQPTQMLLAEAIRCGLQESLQAWDAGHEDAAGALLAQAVDAARRAGQY